MTSDKLKRAPRSASLISHLSFVICLFLLACGPDPPDGQASITKLLEERSARDAAFRASSDSPIPAARRADALPLRYFPPDPAFTVPAVLQPVPSGDIVEMPTSTGQIRPMRRVGVLAFSLKGRPLRLAAFVEPGEGRPERLFVPFADETSGRETYAAGRYLDLDRTPTGIYVIDFNRAYNPFCYYDPRFDCPFPPKENRLPLRVTAGEQVTAS